MTAIDELIEAVEKAFEIDENKRWIPSIEKILEAIPAVRAEAERLKTGGVVKVPVKDGLLACPFCGERLEMRGDHDGMGNAWNWMEHPNIEESSCLLYDIRINLTFEPGSTQDEIKWNTRYVPGVDRAQAERSGRIEELANNVVKARGLLNSDAGVYRMDYDINKLRAELEGKP